MKHIAAQLKDKAFTEHLDEIQLALFTDNKLEVQEKEEVFKHLSECKRCRDILKIASEIRTEEKKLKPTNNTDYKGVLKRFGSVAAIFVVFISVPKIDGQFDSSVVFKGSVVEKGIIDASIEYWEKLFDKYFGGDE
jgi:hypothetical protein